MDIYSAITEISESGLYGNQVHQETLELALAALQEQAERKKGCEYCNGEKPFEIHFDGERAGIAYLHKGSDGWGLFLQMDGGDTYYTDVVNCPMCGRRLK